MPKRVLYNKGKLVNAWVPEDLAEEAYLIAAIKNEKISEIIRESLRLYVNQNNRILERYKELKNN